MKLKSVYLMIKVTHRAVLRAIEKTTNNVINVALPIESGGGYRVVLPKDWVEGVNNRGVHGLD